MTNKERKYISLYSIKDRILLQQYPYTDIKEKEAVVSRMLYFIDCLCETFDKPSITIQLNDFQKEIYNNLDNDSYDNSVFSNKNKIPLYFINLFLKDVNMILEDK